LEARPNPVKSLIKDPAFIALPLGSPISVPGIAESFTPPSPLVAADEANMIAPD
jgi:hypothetical protein